jgi:hypothetical protein
MDDELNKIFSTNASDLFSKKETSEDTVFYKPTPDKGIDKVYTSQIVFLPNAKNPSLHIVDKWTVWIDDIENNRKMNVDCPSTVKKHSLLQDAFFACRNSQNANERKLQNLFKRKRDIYALVYIVQDQHQPEMEGKIKIFKFGQQLFDILEGAAQDTDEPINFLDIMNNKIFKLVVNEVNVDGRNFPNYKLSKFLNKSHQFEINGKIIKKEKNDMLKLANWLKENSPDLDAYQYQEWDSETRKKVVEYIKATIPSQNLINEILKKSKETLSEFETIDKENIKSKDRKNELIPDNYDDEFEDIKSNNGKEKENIKNKQKITDEDLYNLDDIDDTDDLDDLDDLFNEDENE